MASVLKKCAGLNHKHLKVSLCHRYVHDFCDVVVAGGGLVGAAAAACIAKNPLLKNQKVVMLEMGPKRAYKFSKADPYRNRTVSLNGGSVKLLDSLNVWKRIEQIRCRPVKRLKVWESCSGSAITFDHDNLVDDVSHIVENDLIVGFLQEELSTLAGDTLELVYDARIKRIDLPGKRDPGSNDNLAKVELEDGRVIHTSLLIGADGGKSSVRSAMGSKYLKWDYGQRGIVATLRLSEPCENNVSWQRFLVDGTIALLPLTDELSSLVWCTSSPRAEELLQMEPELFVDALNSELWDSSNVSQISQQVLDVFGQFLRFAFPSRGSITQLPPSIIDIEKDSRAAFPLSFGHSVQYVGSRVALIGDAAHTVHPLAGLGLNLGFGDVSCLVNELANAVYDGCEIGDLTPLLRYETKRQRHNIMVSMGIDALQKLYTTNLTPVIMLRSLGLELTNSLTPVKKRIMQQAAI